MTRNEAIAKSYTDSSNLLKCANLILAEREGFPEHPYFLVGTAFAVRHGANLWLITAKHCLKNCNLEAHDLRFLPYNDEREFLRTTEIVNPQAKSENNADHCDFVLFRINLESLRLGDLGRIKPFPLSRNTCVKADDARVVWYHFRGYPLDLSSIDYDGQKIKTQAFESDAHFAGPDEATHCYKLTYKPNSLCTNPNGLSGSPVLASVDMGNTIRVALTGMIISAGGSNSSRLRMIGVETIISAIEKASGQTS